MAAVQGFATAGKSWVALIGSVLTFVIPWLVSLGPGLPFPWPLVISGIVALLTAFGVYHAPYKATGTTPPPAPPAPAPPGNSSW